MNFSFKNIDGFSALSGGVIQITKNFKNLGEMTGDKDCDSIFSALTKWQRIEILFIASKLFERFIVFESPIRMISKLVKDEMQMARLFHTEMLSI